MTDDNTVVCLAFVIGAVSTVVAARIKGWDWPGLALAWTIPAILALMIGFVIVGEPR